MCFHVLKKAEREWRESLFPSKKLNEKKNHHRSQPHIYKCRHVHFVEREREFFLWEWNCGIKFMAIAIPTIYINKANISK